MENIKTLEAACEAAELEFSNASKVRCFVVDNNPSEDVYDAATVIFEAIARKLDILTDRLHDLKK